LDREFELALRSSERSVSGTSRGGHGDTGSRGETGSPCCARGGDIGLGSVWSCKLLSGERTGAEGMLRFIGVESIP
jgi:hypothetical protein